MLSVAELFFGHRGHRERRARLPLFSHNPDGYQLIRKAICMVRL